MCRFEKDQYEKVPFFMFGDYNFRLDTHHLVKVGWLGVFFYNLHILFNKLRYLIVAEWDD